MTISVPTTAVQSTSSIETALDLGARFLMPLQDSDTLSLTFGAVALLISSIASWILDDEDPIDNIDFDIENAIENRNGLKKDKLFFYQSELNKLEPIKREKDITMNDYKETISAYEEFMTWSKQETRDNAIIEDVLELAIAKARGETTPADKFYKKANAVVNYLFGTVVGFFGSFFF